MKTEVHDQQPQIDFDLEGFSGWFASALVAETPQQLLKRLIELLSPQEGQNLISSVAAKYEAGGSLAEAFRSFPQFFPGDFCEMVHAGEASGKLPAALKSYCNLQKHLEGFAVSSDQAFALRLGTLLSTGIPLLPALKQLREAEDPLMQAAIEDLITTTRAGEHLATAMVNHPLVFPELLVSMVAEGQATGSLPIALEYYLQKT